MKEWRKQQQKSWVHEVSTNINSKRQGMHSMTPVQRKNAENIIDKLDMEVMGTSAYETVICICVLILRLGGKRIRLDGQKKPKFLKDNKIDEDVYRTFLEGLMRNFLKIY